MFCIDRSRWLGSQSSLGYAVRVGLQRIDATDSSHGSWLRATRIGSKRHSAERSSSRERDTCSDRQGKFSGRGFPIALLPSRIHATALHDPPILGSETPVPRYGQLR